MRRLWTYSDGAVTVKGYRLPNGTARAASWVLVDQATGNVQGVVPPGEFSRRFRPLDLFADVPGLPTYLGTVTASDGTALADLVLDRNPFMLAWTSSTGAWHGPMVSRPNPSRSWAEPSTWCGPAWPTRSGSVRHNGPQRSSGGVSRPSPPGTR
jgi:hypothetical protein